MAITWHSARLVYRSLEKEDDDGLLTEMSADPEALANASPMLWKPQGKKDMDHFRELLDKQLMCCVVCLPAPEADPTATNSDGTPKKPKPIPIGIVSIQPVEPRMAHHRRSELGINILREYQNQGYGTEAIYWALDWGFQYANLHRIELNAYGANSRAIKLYERMGFTLEGRRRDCIWIHGRFWDDVCLSMLEDEWRARRKEVLKIVE